MKDWMIHAVSAAIMVVVYTATPSFVLPVIAVSAHWYCWELAQMVAKDESSRGFSYWWNMTRWSDTAKLEALAPILSSFVWWLTGVCGGFLVNYHHSILRSGQLQLNRSKS